MSNPQIKHELDPSWFLPAPNQDPYTKGFYAGRDYEQNRIVAILEDWTLNAQWTWADVYTAIEERMEKSVTTISKQSLDALVFDKVNQERERIIDNIKIALTNQYGAALDGNHNPVIDPILATVKEAIYGQATDSSDYLHG
jgi:hypothetical protein